MEKMENLIPLKNSGKNRLMKLFAFLKTPTGIILSLILILASFLRLYRISDYMTFLGDEGRDAIVAKEILNGNLTLLGPRASAGDFFLGPIYYYMIAPFLAIFNYDPVGPAVMVAIFGIATVFLVFYTTYKLFGKNAAIIASSLYAISPIVIAFSRSSWNPNPVPFFSLLMFFALYLSIKKNSYKTSLIIGILLGITLQLHYIAVFIGVIIFLSVLAGNFYENKKTILKSIISQYVSILGGFILGLSPFIAFELRNGFPNTKTIFNFVFIDNFKEKVIQDLTYADIVRDVLFRLFARLTLNYPPVEQIESMKIFDLQMLQLVTIVLILGSFIALIFVKNKLATILILIWVSVGVLLFGFYKKEIYDYYYGFLFPFPFILVSIMLSKLISIKGKLKYLGVLIGFILFGFLFYRLISSNPFRFEPNRQKNEAENIANVVIDVANGKPYNFALITSGNSDHVYRYFLEAKGKAPVTIENFQIDPKRLTVTEQLIVICDSDCQPVGNSLWEVAGFGRAEIENQWEVPFVTIYKLTHVEEEN